MTNVVRVRRAAALMKPPHGDSCNRCGACCEAALCPLAAFVLQRPQFGSGGCPALSGEPGETICGMVADPARWSPVRTAIHGANAMQAAAYLLIGASDGCDARFNGEPINKAFNRKLERLDIKRADRLADARKLWMDDHEQ